MKTVSILAALGLACAALVVYADPAAAPQGMHRHGHGFAALLKAADANGDGVLTRDEALAFAAQRFDALDANHDGKLTADEVRASFQQKRAERWKKIDTDGDGRISKEEFELNKVVALFHPLDRPRSASGAPPGPMDRQIAITRATSRLSPQAFNTLDVNGDGVLTGGEIISSDQMQFEAIDRNGDGYIDRAEFDALVASLFQ